MDFEELLEQIKTDYLNPPVLPDGRKDADRNGHTRLSELKSRYNLSSLKIQKLLVTAGVYEPVKSNSSYYDVKNLHEAGKTVDEIMKELSLSKAMVNASIPYERGAKELDKLGVEITDVAARKRKQRSIEKMRKENARTLLMNNMSDAAFWAALTQHQGDVFLTSQGEHYTYRVEGENVIIGGKRYTKESVVAVLHNGLEIMARDMEGPASLTDHVREEDFAQSDVLPYIYPLLVYFHIVDGNAKDFTAKKAETRIPVCSCCGRRTEKLYRVRCYTDLVDIAEEEEKKERSAWGTDERQRVELMEAMAGRRWNDWQERRSRENPAIHAYNKMLKEEGEHYLCQLCTATIRMALEDGDAPKAETDRDYSVLPIQTLRRLFLESLEERPVCTFTDQFQSVISPQDFSPNPGDGGRYLFRAVDARGDAHQFILSMWNRAHSDGDRGLGFSATEIHKLTKAGKIAANNTITDYHISHFKMLYKGEDKDRNILEGFLELEAKVNHRLRNLTLSVSNPVNSNAVWKGKKKYEIESLGEITTVSMNGVFRSVDQSWDGGEYGYMIDGMVFTGNEVALMMSCYEGVPVVFQAGMGNLKAGECLVPTVLTEKDLVNETIELMNMFCTDGRFEREKDRENFKKLFEKEVITKLKLYHESRPRGYGRLAGMEIIKRLKWVEDTGAEQDRVRQIIR